MRKLIKLVRLLRWRTYRRGLRFGVAATIEHSPVIEALQLRSVVDVGANIGQFSLLIEQCHPHAVIHAFEPVIESAEVFAKVFYGNNNVTLHQVAAGAFNGEHNVYISGRADSSSLLPISAVQVELNPGTAEVAIQKVNVKRLDDVIKPNELPFPMLIKLDIQGYELEALRGMPELLSHAQYIYIELSFIELYVGQPLAHTIIEWLSLHGFYLRSLGTAALPINGISPQVDALFQRA